MALFGPLNAHFLENGQFSAPGAKIPENTLFCQKFIPETIFGGFWAFLRFFDFFTFLTHVPPKEPNWHYCGITVALLDLPCTQRKSRSEKKISLLDLPCTQRKSRSKKKVTTT